MRVAFVTLVDPAGASGQNLFSRATATALARRDDVSLTLICPRPSDGLPDDLADAVTDVVFLPAKRTRSVRWQLGVQRQLAATLRERGPSLDGIVTPFRPGSVLPPLAAIRYDVPLVLLVEGMEARNVRAIGPFPGASLLVHLVATLNAAASAAVFASYEEIRAWLAGLPLVDGSKIEVFHHGVDDRRFRPHDRLDSRRAVPVALPENAPLVGYVGSFKPYHALPALLRAVADGPVPSNCHVLLVGDGPEREDVATLADSLGIADRVHLPGYVDHEAVPRYVGACDVTYGVVDPDHWGSPMKVFEYLACARPVVAFDSPDLSFVEEVDAGHLVDDVSPDAVGAALGDLWDRTPDERDAMGDAGRQYVLENRTWADLARRVVAALN